MHVVPPQQRRRHQARWPALLLACLLAAVSLAEVVHAVEPDGHAGGEPCAFCAASPGGGAVLPAAAFVHDHGEHQQASASPAPLLAGIRAGCRHRVRAPPA